MRLLNRALVCLPAGLMLAGGALATTYGFTTSKNTDAGKKLTISTKLLLDGRVVPCTSASSDLLWGGTGGRSLGVAANVDFDGTGLPYVWASANGAVGSGTCSPSSTEVCLAASYYDLAFEFALAGLVPRSRHGARRTRGHRRVGLVDRPHPPPHREQDRQQQKVVARRKLDQRHLRAGRRTLAGGLRGRDLGGHDGRRGHLVRGRQRKPGRAVAAVGRLGHGPGPEGLRRGVQRFERLVQAGRRLCPHGDLHPPVPVQRGRLRHRLLWRRCRRDRGWRADGLRDYDCADARPHLEGHGATNPAAPEVCGNAVDDDCDERTDGGDGDCPLEGEVAADDAGTTWRTSRTAS